MHSVASSDEDSTVTGWQVAFGLSLFAVIWLVLLTWTTRTAPADNIEQLNWVRAMAWGYYKHPPLPTWLLGVGVWIFGASAQLTYVIGAACTLASMAMLWKFLSQVRGPSYATIALFAALGITYYNDRLQFFNHNIVLMVAATSAAMFAYAGMTRTGLRWWFGLGLALGLGTLAKYQMAVTGLSVAAFWLSQRGWQSRDKRIGLATSLLVALLVIAPHLYWLTRHDYQPITYAMTSSLGIELSGTARLAGSAAWLADQIFNRALPAWLLLLLAAAPWKQCGRPPDRQRVRTRDCASALLVCWGIVPLAFIVALGLATGAQLQSEWGTPFMLFLVPAAMELLGWSESSSTKRMRRALVAFAGLQLVLLMINFLTSSLGPQHWRHEQWEAFDGRRFRESGCCAGASSAGRTDPCGRGSGHLGGGRCRSNLQSGHWF